MTQIRNLKLSGRSDAKGRNGYFVLAEVDVWKYNGKIRVELFSKTRGQAPPALLELEPADMNRLIGVMRAVAEEKDS